MIPDEKPVTIEQVVNRVQRELMNNVTVTAFNNLTPNGKRITDIYLREDNNIMCKKLIGREWMVTYQIVVDDPEGQYKIDIAKIKSGL